MGASAAGAYEIEQSLRFNSYSSAKLTRTFGTNSSDTTKTLSFWMKRGRLGTYQKPFATTSHGNIESYIRINNDDTLQFEDRDSSSGSTDGRLVTNRKFRDTSAWYHIVLTIDTTNGTAGDRVRIYVNGVRETSFSSTTNPASSYAVQFFRSSADNFIGAGDVYFDGYLAEINFVDGTALDSSSFGETNEDTGQWIPKEYTGAHGTNGFYLNFAGDSLNNAFVDSSSNARTVTTVGNAVHSTAQEKIGASSIRRPSSPNSCIHVPDSSDFDWGTNDWTLECWVRRDAQGADEWLMAHSDGTGANTSIGLHIWSSSVANSNKVNIRMRQSSSNLNCTGTTELAADTWYHVAGVRDGNTLRLYINGVQEATTSISGSPDTSSAPFAFTALRSNGDAGLTGYMDEIRVSNNCRYTSGTSFTPSTSAFSSDGNTLVLIHSDFTGTDIAADASSNSNNWQANTAISITAGVNNDVLEDSPTNNFCTVNQLAGRTSNLVEAQDGLLYSPFAGGTLQSVTATQAIKSGKWYWEVTTTLVGTQTNLGVCLATWDQTDIPLEGWRNYQNNGNKNTATNGTNTATSSWGATFTDGDVIGVAVDMSAGTITFYKNGSSQGAAYSDLASAMPRDGWIPMGYGAAGSWNWNFGQRPFAHTPPANHLKLCTKNMPEPTIKKGSDYFNTVTYTANATAGRTLSGIGFSPNLCWFGRRNDSGASTEIFDTVRGPGKALNVAYSDPYETEDGVTSFTSPANDGVTLGATWPNARNNDTWVAWNWKESATAGFDIVGWTGDGASSRNVSHSLGVVPELMIVKGENNNSSGGPCTLDKNGWFVYHEVLGNQGVLGLNENHQACTGQSIWNSTTPTSSVFSLGNLNSVNQTSNDYIAYLWASVEGFSKVGSYVGNGDAYGTFVYTGFRPAWIMMKDSSGANSWEITDTTRQPYNDGRRKILRADTNDAELNEADAYGIDILSNGFKPRYGGSSTNDTGPMIYLAFAERPFKYANAR